jgi:hypothetical protein
MKREYQTGTSEDITLFVGIEIEKTPAYGLKTLFVVGVLNEQVITEVARNNNCTHIYFGANQSFATNGVNDSRTWTSWENMIRYCLESGVWCTLDLDVREVEGLLESCLVEHRKFIPQISVKLPYLQQLGYNATIKLDDKDCKATNHGVWCHNLQDLLDRNKFTSWDQSGKDEIIK